MGDTLQRFLFSWALTLGVWYAAETAARKLSPSDWAGFALAGVCAAIGTAIYNHVTDGGR